jgi:hypothetical protein
MHKNLNNQLKECHNAQTTNLIQKASFEGYTDTNIPVCFLRQKNNKKQRHKKIKDNSLQSSILLLALV